MRTLLLGLGIVIASSVFAQRECGSSNYNELQKAADPLLAARAMHIESFIRQQAPVAAKQNGEAINVVRIPVVVHVIYKSQSQNISDEQIKSQIDALNRDFRKRNGDTANTPVRFKHMAADVQIEFELAKTDPSGRATTGIIRKQSNVSNWLLDDKIKFSSNGGDNAWDSRFYLNIWVGNLFGVIGFSSLPGAPAEKDGVVLHYKSFGTFNSNAPYDKGRTTVHEVGHWLGLKHIWGDTYCGDDLVHDTPKQGNFTSGCPNSFRSSCSNGATGDMYMNYMDYTNDACMNMFTEGQKQRMLALFNQGGPRNTILSSKGLSDAWVVEGPEAEVSDSVVRFSCYPNPAKNSLVLNFPDASWTGKTLVIYSVNGNIQNRFVVTSKTQKININGFPGGLYFIEGVKDGQRIREKFIKL